MKRISFVLVLSTLMFVGTASADTVFTDFSAGQPTGDLYNVDVTNLPGSAGNTSNFTAISGNFDILLATGAYGPLCGSSSATACIDLNGDTQGTLGASIAVVAGQTYTLTYTLLPAQRQVVGGNTTITFVGAGAAYNANYTGDSGQSTEVYTFTATADGTAALQFASGVIGSAGDILESVSVTTPSLANAAVPEPSTLLLFSLPLLAFGSKAVRRSRG